MKLESEAALHKQNGKKHNAFNISFESSQSYNRYGLFSSPHLSNSFWKNNTNLVKMRFD